MMNLNTQNYLELFGCGCVVDDTMYTCGHPQLAQGIHREWCPVHNRNPIPPRYKRMSEEKDVVEAEAAIGRALARTAWRRLKAGDSSFAIARYPKGEDEYAELEWMKYREDAMATLAALEAEGYKITRSLTPRLEKTAMNEWQTMETAPKDGTVILITDGKVFAAACPFLYTEPATIGYHGAGLVPSTERPNPIAGQTKWLWTSFGATAWEAEDVWVDYDMNIRCGRDEDASTLIEPTHWMPLPDPPGKAAPSLTPGIIHPREEYKGE